MKNIALSLFLSATLLGCVPDDGFVEHPQVLIERVNNFFSKGRYQEAINSWDEAIKHNPGNFSARKNRGIALERLGRVNDDILMP